jgi:MoCo/4Fe-4S cofactor protein with predicted Tat translocation signal
MKNTNPHELTPRNASGQPAAASRHTAEKNTAPLKRLPAENGRPIDLSAIRERLKAQHGQLYWRSLDELAETPEFKQMLEREFPPGASEWWDGVSRRNFLKLAAATLALSGLTACTKQPTREIFPYVNQPEGMVLGDPLYYATSILLGGFATGLLVKSREGHPIKVDGNPDHPASLGGSSVWIQTSILNLYDPDRSQTATHRGEISTWAGFLSDLLALMKEQEAKQGAGLRFLTDTVTSPALAAQFGELGKRFPKARWCQYDPILRDNVREGARLAFGRFVETHYRFDKAQVIVALDSDFLYTHPQRLAYDRQFIDGRRVSTGKREMSRLYVVESTPTVTGSMADHRLPLESAKVEQLARQLVGRLGPSAQNAEPQPNPDTDTARWIEGLVRNLKQHSGKSIVIAGECQPPIVHALAHYLNEILGNPGQTLFYTETAEVHPLNQATSIAELTREMVSGTVDALFILGVNPVYSAPVDLQFRDALLKVKRSIHLGIELDETGASCTWHIPQATWLESWGDARSFDGTVSFMQPLIAPLYDGKTALELIGAMLQQQPVRTDYDILHDHWQKQRPGPDFDQRWRKTIHDGFIPDTRLPAIAVQVTKKFAQDAAVGGGAEIAATANDANRSPRDLSSSDSRFVITNVVRETQPASNEPGPFGPQTRKFVQVENLEISFRPDPSLWDGQFANNGWLQECPRPVHKLTWDNAVLISPALAEKSGLQTGEVVEISFRGRTVRGPIWIMPGQAESTITLHLGYGRERVGRVGEGVGFNAYALRPSDALWFGNGATITATGQTHLLVATQTHHNLHSPERQVYRAAGLEELRSDPEVIKRTIHVPEREETLYYPDEYKYPGYKWGMSIDLTACIGCNACVVACEVENNIPVVGKEQVHKNREMLWIRIDTWYKGTLDNPEFNHAPVPCMQCEHAPCEVVCPVEAAVHDSEGLNLQIYNRCVGTRFCSNNCPYKVRRFNFLRYTDYHTPNFKPMYNPEVTVRWRGVMEKCTYCVQRIAAARITTEKENRRIKDGEVKTACQQA